MSYREAFCHANCIVACLITVWKYPTKGKLKKVETILAHREKLQQEVMVIEELEVKVGYTTRKQKEMNAVSMFYLANNQ